jgi:HEAT repeat protein
MRFGLKDLRYWARVLERVLARWRTTLKARRFGQRGQVVAAAHPLTAEAGPDNDNAAHRPLPGRSIPPERLMGELAQGSDWQSRARAASGLTAVEADGVVAALVHALSDPSVEVAVAAIQALSARHEVRVVGALREVVGSTDGYFSPVTRAAAITVLAKRLAVPELEPIFDAVRDVDADVSIAAIAAIAEHAPHTAATHILPLLEDRSGYFLPLVRLAATNALDGAGALTPDVAARLLESEPDSAVRSVLERAASGSLSA